MKKMGCCYALMQKALVEWRRKRVSMGYLCADVAEACCVV